MVVPPAPLPSREVPPQVDSQHEAAGSTGEAEAAGSTGEGGGHRRLGGSPPIEPAGEPPSMEDAHCEVKSLGPTCTPELESSDIVKLNASATR